VTPGEDSALFERSGQLTVMQRSSAFGQRVARVRRRTADSHL